MSGYQHLPTQDEVMSYDQRWVGDMQLAYQLYSFLHNNHPLMQIFEQGIAGDKDEKGKTHYVYDPKNPNRQVRKDEIDAAYLKGYSARDTDGED